MLQHRFAQDCYDPAFMVEPVGTVAFRAGQENSRFRKLDQPGHDPAQWRLCRQRFWPCFDLARGRMFACPATGQLLPGWQVVAEFNHDTIPFFVQLCMLEMLRSLERRRNRRDPWLLA